MYVSTRILLQIINILMTSFAHRFFLGIDYVMTIQTPIKTILKVRSVTAPFDPPFKMTLLLILYRHKMYSVLSLQLTWHCPKTVV